MVFILVLYFYFIQKHNTRHEKRSLQKSCTAVDQSNYISVGCSCRAKVAVAVWKVKH